jgi:hypothetical protein
MVIRSRKATVYIPGFHPITTFRIWNQVRKLSLAQAEELAGQAEAHGWNVKREVRKPIS